MKDRIAILIPSRDRPDELFKAVESIMATSTKADVFVYVDRDQKQEYLEKMPKLTSRGSSGKIASGPQEGPVLAANNLLKIALEPEKYFAYGLFVDDCTFTIPGWDEAVTYEAERAGDIWAMSPAHSRGAFMDFAFISDAWARRLGWIAYPALYQWCWPSIIEVLGHATTLVNVPPETMFVDHPERIPANRDKSREDFQQFYNFFSTNKCSRVLELLKVSEQALAEA